MTSGVFLGVGASSSATIEEIGALADGVLRRAGTAWAAVAAIATTVALSSDPRLHGLGPPVIGFEPAVLAGVEGVTASARVEAEIGASSVAEAAALLAAGPRATLVVPKSRSAHATAALAASR